MTENTKNGNVLFAVGADAPDWLREIGDAITECYTETHGAILFLCKEKSQSQLIANVTIEDVLTTIKSLCDEVRDLMPTEIADIILLHVLSSSKQRHEEEEDD